MTKEVINSSETPIVRLTSGLSGKEKVRSVRSDSLADDVLGDVPGHMGA